MSKAVDLFELFMATLDEGEPSFSVHFCVVKMSNVQMKLPLSC